MSADDRFRDLRLQHNHLDPIAPPGLKFVSVARADNLLFVSGEGPLQGNKFVYRGKVGRDVSMVDAKRAAVLTGLNLIYSVQKELGTLNQVKRVVEVFGMVSAVDRFADQPAVVNSLSDTVLQVFGDTVGSHSRCAIGVADLPFQMCFEAKMTLSV